MTTKAKGTSVRQRLINLSVEIGVPFQNLETAFILERLVARLTADAELQKHLVFRGGSVGLKVHNSARYTGDVDALIVKSDVESILERSKRSAETDWATECVRIAILTSHLAFASYFHLPDDIASRA